MHDIDRALFEYESEGEQEGEMNETLELAGELLEISSEQELEAFLGDLIGKAVGVGKSFLNSDAGRAVSGLVRSAAKTALPQIGQAIGNRIAPGVGGQWGQKAGSWASGALGLELEGLSQEDRELEAAKAVVRFTQTAAQTAAQAPPTQPPTAVAVRAALQAAQRHLPGLVPIIRQLAGTVRQQRRQLAQQSNPAPSGEFEFEFENENESESEGESEFEFEAEYEYELELAQELLEVSSEQELEQFIGKLVKSVGKGLSSFAKSGIGKAVGGVLKNVAKTALPMVGSAVGSFLLPGVGTALGGQLGSMAGKLLEVGEYESMSEAEAELESSRRFVQFGRATTRYAMNTPRSVPPRVAARAAATTAARRYAPGLLRSSGGRSQQNRSTGRSTNRSTGNWRTRRDSRLSGAQRPYRQYQPSRSRRVPWQWNDWGQLSPQSDTGGDDAGDDGGNGGAFGGSFQPAGPGGDEDESGFEFE